MGKGVSILPDGFESVKGENIPVPRGPYSPAIVWGDLVFVSGLLAVKQDGDAVCGDIREEAMIVLRNLKNLLEATGSGLEKVLAVTVYLSDISNLMAFNEVYEEYFKPPYPSRSAMGVSLLGAFQVELAAIAYRE